MSCSASASNHSLFDWNFSFIRDDRTGPNRTSASVPLPISSVRRSVFILQIRIGSNRIALCLNANTVDASTSTCTRDRCSRNHPLRRVRILFPVGRRIPCATSSVKVIKTVSYLILFSSRLPLATLHDGFPLNRLQLRCRSFSFLSNSTAHVNSLSRFFPHSSFCLHRRSRHLFAFCPLVVSWAA